MIKDTFFKNNLTPIPPYTDFDDIRAIVYDDVVPVPGFFTMVDEPHKWYVASNVTKIELFATENHLQPFKLPFVIDRPLPILTIKGTYYTSFRMESFDEFKNVRNLNLEALTVSSFSGFESSGISSLYLGHGVTVECGLLRLLRNKALRSVECISSTRLAELMKATGLIQELIESRNVSFWEPHYQEEMLLKLIESLHDNDLEKYAKM